MAIKVGVPEAGVKNLVEQAYRAGAQYQWARETLVNALQAHATWVEFGVEPQLVTTRGVTKRYVADNGIGMDEDELLKFMAAFGGGGKPIGMQENFGQGQKSSSYPWNGYGLIVLSWTKANPAGCMIWIHRDAEGDYSLREFEVEDDEGNLSIVGVVQPGWDDDLQIDLAQLYLPEIQEAGHGTVFLFLGDSLEEDTERGDQNKDEVGIRGIVKYLNTRFIGVPDEVKIGVVAMETKTEATGRRNSKDHTLTYPSGKKRSWHNRYVHGVEEFIPTGTSGSVQIDEYGTMAHWTLADQPGATGGGSYGPGGAFIMVEYQTSYDGVLFSEAYNTTSSLMTYRNFGISSNKVAARLWLRIQPPVYIEGSPDWGVLPQASRGMLIGKGMPGLPWDAWADEFARKLPAKIQAAIDIDQATPSTIDATKMQGRVKDLITRLNMRMRPKRLVESLKGTELGEPASGGTGTSRRTGVKRTKVVKPTPPDNDGGDKNKLPVGATGSTSLLIPDANGGHTGVSSPRGNGIPAVEWQPAAEWQDGFKYAAAWVPKGSLNGSAGIILVNLGFKMFADEFTFWINEYPKADSNEVIQVVKDQYEIELVTKVMHAVKLEGQVHNNALPGRFSSSEISQMLTHEALTLSVLGLVNVEGRIRTIAGGKFGRKAVTV